MPKITVIPSTINPNTNASNFNLLKRRVCGYARVSTDTDEQFTSYEAQVDYYTKFIKNKPEWEFVNVYTDEGISGTNTRKRIGFKTMMEDALNGKIDLIVTKSISRFARNTVDTLVNIRKLKEKGVECFFEKENIYTFDSKGELLITIMSSLAQEESRSISQNVTWGMRKSFSDGKVRIPFKNFLGYKKGPNSEIEIDEDEAMVVKKIYQLFLVEGKSCSGIANYLKANNVLTPSGKSVNWSANTVYSILTNEKYKGDALLQKKFTDNYLEHTTKKNTGQLPQYYVENSHPAIIDRAFWDEVQAEMARRDKLGAKYSSTSIFASKLICGDCGAFYGKKKWHSTDKYACEVYQCNRKFVRTNKRQCSTPTLKEETIKEMFVNAYNEVMGDKERLIEDTREVIATLTDTSSLESKIQACRSEIEILSGFVQKLIKKHASSEDGQEEFDRKYSELSERYDKAKGKLEVAEKEKVNKLAQAIHLNSFLANLMKSDQFIDTWNEELWMFMVEKAVMNRDGTVRFFFKNGTVILKAQTDKLSAVSKAQ